MIKHLEVDFDRSLNIITGETGAGKSIILGAISLLKGERADTKALLNIDEKCVIEALFQVAALQMQQLFEDNDLPYDNECIVRREIAPNGRSRAFVNDVPVTLEVLSQITQHLLDIHSQHDTLLLESQNYQLQLLDIYAGNSNLLQQYQSAYRAFNLIQKELLELQQLNTQNLKSNDFDSFLLEELIAAKLEPDEEKSLKAELYKIENAEEIKLKLNLVKQQFDDTQYGVLVNLKSASSTLDKISNFDDEIKVLKNRVVSCYEELKDVLIEIESKDDSIGLDEQKAQVIRQRLDVVYALQTKHRVSTIDELLKIQEDLGKKLTRFSNLEEKIKQLEESLIDTRDHMMQCASGLSQARLQSKDALAKNIEGLLKDISMQNAEVQVEHLAIVPNKYGIDQFDILFSANKGIKPQKLKNVASGGEFSRLMLCIKHVLATKKAMPTIIFDEIDTGVSGEVALKMAQMMKTMSQNHQVITITHLPQIAAFGKKHFFVYKDDTSSSTTSNMKELKSEEREKHLAEMIGGKNPTDTSLASARELLLNYNN